MRAECIERIEKTGLVVIVRGAEREKLLPLGEALYRAGVRAMEITFDSGGTVSDEKTAESLRLLAEAFRGRMSIGAGTVLTEKQVRLVGEAGGVFVVSPDTNEAVIRATRQLGLVSVPGALTPTEVLAAHRAGADFVKLFPVTALGPGYLKSIAAPLSHVKFLAVGSMQAEELPAYLKAGAAGACVGGGIVDPQLLAREDYPGITERAKAYLDRLAK